MACNGPGIHYFAKFINYTDHWSAKTSFVHWSPGLVLPGSPQLSFTSHSARTRDRPLNTFTANFQYNFPESDKYFRIALGQHHRSFYLTKHTFYAAGFHGKLDTNAVLSQIWPYNQIWRTSNFPPHFYVTALKTNWNWQRRKTPANKSTKANINADNASMTICTTYLNLNYAS